MAFFRLCFASGNFVVIELKPDIASDKVIGQISRYMGAIMDEYNIPKEKIRGLIISKGISKNLEYAVKILDNIKLIQLSLEKENIKRTAISIKLSEHTFDFFNELKKWHNIDTNRDMVQKILSDQYKVMIKEQKDLGLISD